MQIAHTIADLRRILGRSRRPAFVPTMGNLHDGHIALVRQAKPLGDVSVASIFVNRLPNEDLDNLPAHLGIGLRQARRRRLRCPVRTQRKRALPAAQTYKVHPPAELADTLEGHFRPGFLSA